MSQRIPAWAALGVLLLVAVGLSEAVRWDTYRPTLADTDGCPCVGSNKRIINVLDFNLRDDLRHCPYKRSECIKAVAQIILDYEVDVALFQEVNVTAKPNILNAIVYSLNQTAPKMYSVVPNTMIITRLKVAYVDPLDGPERASGALLNIAPGWYSFFFSVHLTAMPYGPHLLRDRQLVSSVVLTANAVQLADTKRFLTRIWDLAEKLDKTHDNRGAANTHPARDNVDTSVDPFFKPESPHSKSLRGNHPVVLGGDFNMPSHLDHDIHTATAANYTKKRGLPVIAELEWPVTRLLNDSGYHDAYRVVYPNAVTHPGFTWPAIPIPGAVRDRIDYIFYRPTSPIYPPSEPAMRLHALESSRVNPFAKSPDGKAQDLFSDHRAVFSRIRFTWPEPGPPPPIPPPLTSENH